MQIKKELQKNKQAMQEAFRDCGDIIMREFRIRGGEGTLFLAYTDNIGEWGCHSEFYHDKCDGAL